MLITRLVVMGSTLPAPGSTLPARPQATALSEALTSTTTSGQVHFTRKSPSATVKIVQATMKCLASGTTERVTVNQTFVDVTQITANVRYISSVVQTKWGSQYVLVTSGGLKLDDSSGKQGN